MFARFHLETSILGSYDKLPLIWLLKFESQFPTLICKEREGGKEGPDRQTQPSLGQSRPQTRYVCEQLAEISACICDKELSSEELSTTCAAKENPT